ncbi:MAG TPA: addiction module protein [Thermoanaerobaculia bacterium]|nr:addiction module protein [Thermoanaerobaculia bacterium]
MSVADLEVKLLKLEALSEQEIEALWLEEADRRDQELDADPSRAIPGADVMREARALLS